MKEQDTAREGQRAGVLARRRVDVAVLGAGTAGLGAHRAAQRAGAQSLLIDPGPFGTTCARIGCMPSKLLIAAAEVAHGARHARRFGVEVSEVVVHGARVLERVRRERDRFVGFVLEAIDEARAADELIEGHARLNGPSTLCVSNQVEVEFGALVIATGSAPVVPPPFRGLEPWLITSDTIFELQELPESVLVIGLGVIGLELGQALARLGVRTTLVGLGGDIGPLSDPELLTVTRTVLQAELDLHPDYELKSIESTDAGVRVHFVDSTGTERRETYARVLMAAGRRPNLEQLGLQHLGVNPSPVTGYAIDPGTLQLGDRAVFVAGDANGLHPLLHEATDDARIAGFNAARFPEVTSPARRTALNIVFTDPQIALVGKSYRALCDCEAVVGEVDYGDQGRARVHSAHRGKARIYADKHTGQLLGAELCAPRAEHLAHLLAWTVQQRLTVEQALGMPFYHPVFEEGLKTALRDANAQLRRGSPIKCRVSELGVGS